MTNRYNTLAATVAAMSEAQAAQALIVEGAPSDDAILGGLFRLTTHGVVDVEAYTEAYDATDKFGKFRGAHARLAAARLYNEARATARGGRALRPILPF
jgi:hypothetical protein